VSDREKERESEREAVIDLLFHIVNPLLFCFLFVFVCCGWSEAVIPRSIYLNFESDYHLIL